MEEDYEITSRHPLGFVECQRCGNKGSMKQIGISPRQYVYYAEASLGFKPKGWRFWK
jgi:hypothetical protein